MGESEHGQEIEIKLKLSSAKEGRRKLAAAGFEERQPRGLEQNTLYDDSERRLRARGDLIRIRHYRGKVVLTFKSRGGERSGTIAGSLHKYRPEQETEVGDAAPVVAALQAAGLSPVLRYEKYRAVYAREGDQGLAMLDETPIGVYLELEGEPGWIDRVAAELGFAAKEYVTASYLSLNEQDCLKNGREVADMVFGETSEQARKAGQ